MLCILAHQDDEIAMATRILREARTGRAIRCVYLTDGEAGGTPARVRNAESLAVLTRLGVQADTVSFLGSQNGIRDQSLVHSLDRSLELLEEHVGRASIADVLCPAWEGGHPDHDASYIIALAFARRRDISGKVWQFPLYNGFRTRGMLFRVMRPVRKGHRTQRIARRDAIRVLGLISRYRSQRTTWLGLLPECFVKLALLGREVVEEATPDVIRQRPHPGKLYYERRFGMSFETWRAAADPFIEKHFFATARRPETVRDRR